MAPLLSGISVTAFPLHEERHSPSRLRLAGLPSLPRPARKPCCFFPRGRKDRGLMWVPGKINSFSSRRRSNDRRHLHYASRLWQPPRIDVRHRSMSPCPSPPPNITSRSHITGRSTAACHSLSECRPLLPARRQIRLGRIGLRILGDPEFHNLVPRGWTYAHGTHVQGQARTPTRTVCAIFPQCRARQILVHPSPSCFVQACLDGDANRPAKLHPTVELPSPHRRAVSSDLIFSTKGPWS